MNNIIKSIFFVIIFVSFAFSQTKAPDFNLKDRNNHFIQLTDFKEKVVVLIFAPTKNKIAVVRAKEIKKAFEGENLQVVFITTDIKLSPIEFNTFIGKNNLNKSGVYTLKGDSWVIKAYKLDNSRTAIFILKRFGDKYFILKRIDDLNNANVLKHAIENALGN